METSQLVITCDPIARFSIKAVRDLDPPKQDLEVLAKINLLVSNLKLSEADVLATVRKLDAHKPFGSSSSSGKTMFGEDEQLLQEEGKGTSSNRTPMDAEDDRIQDAKRQERRAIERLHQFQDRERRWESHESSRLRKLNLEMDSDSIAEAKRTVDGTALAKVLQEYDDDVEQERMEHEYYRDK